VEEFFSNMRYVWLSKLLLLAVGLSSASVADAQAAQHTDSSKGKLKFVLVLSRHGVRSPTWENARLDEYAKQPWPQWPVAPGLLTPHGKLLMTSFGAYYRSVYAERGLLSSDGCKDASRIYLHADTDERTRETAAGLAEGLMPGCNVEVHALSGSTRDSLFHPIENVQHAESSNAFFAISGRIGGDPAGLLPNFRAPLETLQKILWDCSEPSCQASGKKSLLGIEPTLQVGKGDHLVELKGPLSTAATFAENLQLEYLEGMTDVGWGRVDASTLQSLMMLHAASSDLVQRTPFIAREQGANLLRTIMQTLLQAEQEKPVAGAIGNPNSRMVFLVGHDTNISNVAALLDAHWLLSGYQRDDAAPGGALVFELWQVPGKVDTLRVSYVVQTPTQMHEGSPLSLTDPPAHAEIFLPACSRPDEGSPCPFTEFVKTLRAAIPTMPPGRRR
jgi:4-phytase/acid phosphatase